MPTLTADNGQRSAPIGISWLSGLEATNGYIEYTTATLVEAKAGIAVWTTWPVGATAGTAYSLMQMVVRLVGISDGATCVITDPRELIRADSFSLPQVETDPLLWALDNGQIYKAGNVLAGTITGGSGPTPTLGAVSLAFVTTDEDLTGDNVASWQTPGIAFDLPDSAEVGDVLRVQLNEADLGTRTLDADDIDGPFVDFVAASPGAGTYDMRCRLERGAEISAWSNTLELEILAAPTFSLTKVHEASDGADALSYSFSGCAFGAADPNRVVAVVVMSRGNGLYCTDVTIAGVPATLAARNDPYSSVMIEIWSAPIPAGTTGTVSMNMGSASGNASRASISAYRIITSHPEVWDEDIGESGLDGGAGRSMTVTVPAGGAAIVGFTTQTSANSTTWTGATKSAEFNFETFSMHATAIATASGTVTAVPNTSPSSSQILSASWRP